MVTLFFLFQVLSESFSVLRPVFTPTYIFCLSLSAVLVISAYFSPLFSTRIISFSSFSSSLSLSLYCLSIFSLSGFICRSCNITKARFAVSAITEKQITRMHNIIRQCTTLYIYVALYITHCVSAVALIT